MNSKTTLKLSIFCAIIFGMLPLAHAQNNDVESNLEVYRISINENGREVNQKVTNTTPGDTLEYRLTYTNHLSNSISSLQPVLPIPAGLQYIDGSADPQINTVSLDSTGSTFQALPIHREVTLDDGTTEQREVPASQYRRLRWTVDSLGAQQSVTLIARVWVINGNSPQQ